MMGLKQADFLTPYGDEAALSRHTRPSSRSLCGASRVQKGAGIDPGVGEGSGDEAPRFVQGCLSSSVRLPSRGELHRVGRCRTVSQNGASFDARTL